MRSTRDISVFQSGEVVRKRWVPSGSEIFQKHFEIDLGVLLTSSHSFLDPTMCSISPRPVGVIYTKVIFWLKIVTLRSRKSETTTRCKVTYRVSLIV